MRSGDITTAPEAVSPSNPEGAGGDGQEDENILRTISVVLPCAGEGEYAFKTVRSVFETTPADVLKEIIVVDDGSEPPLGDSVLQEEIREKYRVKLLRHAQTVGLIGAKKDGGDAASGDVIVFFDCHVAPQKGWYVSFLQLINDNRRRIVVPMITDLDVSTWRQRTFSHGVAKCYLTWDADFKWYNSDDPYVPVLSGGLLGISQQWWRESGGYDEQMRSWGGENLDQSLRTWLCGGEIVIAKESQVAHMWRRPNDKRTVAHYKVDGRAAARNRLRAAVAWYGDFAEKLTQFPALMADHKDADGNPWFGDISNILSVKERLQCRSFAWFMRRFTDVYVFGGLVPEETFQLRVAGGTKCIAYKGNAGTSSTGRGTAVLEDCNPDDDRQRWHGANRDQSKEGAHCCSGLRAWNTDQCLTKPTNGHVLTYVCDISGKTSDQAWELTKDGQLVIKSGGFLQASCLEGVGNGTAVKAAKCRSNGPPAWVKGDAAPPVEFTLYQKLLREENDRDEEGLE